MNLQETIEAVQPLDEMAMQEAQKRWNSIAKPLNSLGLLESALVKIAGITKEAQIHLDRRCVVVMCADNGVVAQGVTQTGSEVTAIVAENFTRGAASVNAMAKVAHCEVIPVDIGVSRDIVGEGLIVHKIAYGTGDITQGPAMTREQAEDALSFGISLVGKLKTKGYRIIATGEMGIGNTTTSSAVTAALLGCSPEEVTGRGAGLSRAGIRHKAQMIAKAIDHNRPDPADAIDVLQKVGGFDIAGLAGIFLGGAVHRVPILIDGFISAASALVAARICPLAVGYMLASHRSGEPAGRMLLDALGLEPLIDAKMCLGEGTGAVAALPLLDMAGAVYSGMETFEEIQIEDYKPFD